MILIFHNLFHNIIFYYNILLLHIFYIFRIYFKTSFIEKIRNRIIIPVFNHSFNFLIIIWFIFIIILISITIWIIIFIFRFFIRPFITFIIIFFYFFNFYFVIIFNVFFCFSFFGMLISYISYYLIIKNNNSNNIRIFNLFYFFLKNN